MPRSRWCLLGCEGRVVRDLAEQLKQKPFKIIADLMQVGVFATVNQAIDEAHRAVEELFVKNGLT